MTTEERIAVAIARGQNFDSFIAAAARERYGDASPQMLSLTPTFETVPFVELLRASGCPPERIPRLIAMLNDLRLEHHFLLHEVPDYPKGHEAAADLLREAAIDQTYIAMTRIFFERFMNLVCYLELGEELRGRSKKRSFFRMVPASNRWQWMDGFETLIERYDASYRTPEVHSGSVLRGRMERGAPSVFWRTLAPQNLVYGLFTEVQTVLAGGSARLEQVVSNVASDWMVEGHWDYIPPWDEDEAEWRKTLFEIAQLEPVSEPPLSEALPGPPGPETKWRLHVERWQVGPGRAFRVGTGQEVEIGPLPDEIPG